MLGTTKGSCVASTDSIMIPEGPAFLLARYNDKNLSFKKTSPYRIRNTLKTMLSYAPEQVTATRSGALLLKTKDTDQTEALLRWTSIEGKDICVKPADKLNQREGLIYAPELVEESVKTILSESVAQGVSMVTRLPSKNPRPNPLLKLRFASTMLPTHFYAAYVRYEVRPCIPLPRRCGKCLRYGHGKNTCRARAQRCVRCAQEHPSEGCTAPPCCAACQGPHPVNDKACPVWEEKLAALRAQAQTSSTGMTAGTPDEWPSLSTPGPSERHSMVTQGSPRAPGRPQHQSPATGRQRQSPPAEQQRQPPPAEQRRQSPPAEQQRQPPPAEQRRQSPPAEQQRQPPPAEQQRQPPPAEQQRQPSPTEQLRVANTVTGVRTSTSLATSTRTFSPSPRQIPDSDDSSTCYSSEDELTLSTPPTVVKVPKATKQLTSEPKEDSDDSIRSPSPQPTRRASQRLRLRDSLAPKNVGYRTTPAIRRSFIFDELA